MGDCVINEIPVVIPAYEPDERLIALLKSFKENGINRVVIVDDGSGDKYQYIFNQAKEFAEKVLVHPCNRGKGAALKTAFQYVLENYPECGCICVDSDGQHSIECVKKVAECSKDNSGCLVLGVREFKRKEVPFKSYLGNVLTKKIFRYITGYELTDTQTGLRFIPCQFMKECLKLKGNRFEFEMQMLMSTFGKVEILQVPIQTIYDSKENHQTHFNPIRDSIEIYKVLGKTFFRYIFSSVSSFILDILLFMLLLKVFANFKINNMILLATIGARVISAIYNYFCNYLFVFNSKESLPKAGIKYLLLAVTQMFCSAGLVMIMHSLWVDGNLVVVKILVDFACFLGLYFIQQKYIFYKYKV